jgi:hypothetical protein
LNLLKIININIFYTEKNIDFDTDALIGKENGLIINHFTNDKGIIYPFVESVYKIPEEKEIKKIVEDTIGF